VTCGRKQGYELYGCDLNLRDDEQSACAQLVELGFLRPIDPHSYRLPFDDCSFDFVISDQVFEHVMDYPTTLAEIQRVLRAGGVFLHIFPSRYKLIEPHVYIPLATVVRARWWLNAWALAGIRNEFQQQMSASEVYAANLIYLKAHTNYLTKRTLRRLFSEYFRDVQFVERSFLKHSRRGRLVYELSAWFPFLTDLFSAFGSRVVFGRKESVSDLPATS
jgi:SAM-dependent methyltransferase